MQAAGIDTARLDAEVLLAHAMGRERLDVLNDVEQPVPADSAGIFDAFLQRRANAEPVAYITGSTEFWSRTFQVSPDVLIPRPETEVLVEAALVRIPTDSALQVADLGTGSGCIALSMLCERSNVGAIGIDISQAALDVAVRNAGALGVERRFKAMHMSMLDWLKNAEPVDMIVSNPPYISAHDYADLADTVRRYEPRTALYGGNDGLEFYRALARSAARCLRPGGWLLAEMGYNQGSAIEQLFAACFSECVLIPDLAGHDRVICARGAR
ncbi:MAG: peptide chain release factor N(5)-glutamine methyltransferase [Pseudomonadota bacterium]